LDEGQQLVMLEHDNGRLIVPINAQTGSDL